MAENFKICLSNSKSSFSLQRKIYLRITIVETRVPFTSVSLDLEGLLQPFPSMKNQNVLLSQFFLYFHENSQWSSWSIAPSSPSPISILEKLHMWKVKRYQQHCTKEERKNMLVSLRCL